MQGLGAAVTGVFAEAGLVTLSHEAFCGQVVDLAHRLHKADLCGQPTDPPFAITAKMGELEVVLGVSPIARKWHNMIKTHTVGSRMFCCLVHRLMAYLALPLIPFNNSLIVNRTNSGTSLLSALQSGSRQYLVGMLCVILTGLLSSLTTVSDISLAITLVVGLFICCSFTPCSFSLVYLSLLQRGLMLLLSCFLTFWGLLKRFSQSLKSAAFENFIMVSLIINMIFVWMFRSITCFAYPLFFPISHEVIIA